MAYSALPKIEGAAHGVNYGFDRVRFVRPVPSGSRVRGSFTLRAVTPRSAREWQLSYDVSVEVEGTQKPALAATWLTMQVMAHLKAGYGRAGLRQRSVVCKSVLRDSNGLWLIRELLQHGWTSCTTKCLCYLPRQP